MADDSRENDQNKIDSAISELAERKNGKSSTKMYIYTFFLQKKIFFLTLHTLWKNFVRYLLQHMQT